MCFDGEKLSSTIHVDIAFYLVDFIKDIAVGDIVKLRCSLCFIDSTQSLVLIGETVESI